MGLHNKPPASSSSLLFRAFPRNLLACFSPHHPDNHPRHPDETPDISRSKVMLTMELIMCVYFPLIYRLYTGKRFWHYNTIPSCLTEKPALYLNFLPWKYARLAREGRCNSFLLNSLLINTNASAELDIEKHFVFLHLQ